MAPAMSDTKTKAACVLEARASLGECPVWDERAQALYFADIHGPALHRFEPATGAAGRWAMPAKLGSFALDAEGTGAVLALATGFARLDFASGAITPIANPLAGVEDHRFNDGGADPAGRFWAGRNPRVPEPCRGPAARRIDGWTSRCASDFQVSGRGVESQGGAESICDQS
jgi:sugar lactone lactonase YvrE